MRRNPGSAGFTLLETAIVALLVFLLLMMGLPKTMRTYETSRVQTGEAGLQTLWTAQRLYRLHHGEFADAVSDLTDAGLAPPGLADNGGAWVYDVRMAETNRFRMRARRRAESGWSGRLILREDGQLTGGTTHAIAGTVQP